MFMKRIENTIENGTPDLYFVDGCGRKGWCELKVSSGRGDRIILKKYTVAQRRWHKQHMSHAGFSLLAVLHGGKVLWFRGEAVIFPEKHSHFYEGTIWPK
jgi:hypothetical protein